MKVFYQCSKDGHPYNNNVFCAYQGFKEMGFELIPFSSQEDLEITELEDIVVGGIGRVRARLEQLGHPVEEINYPEEIMNYMGRKIWRSTINEVNANPDLWPVFVKPVEGKKFVGVVVNSAKDLIGCGSCYDNADVICSEVLEIVAEWRAFVRYGKILDVRQYNGPWKDFYDPEVIEKCVESYISAPAGCSVDFGKTKDGKTVLIEVNDGYSLGCYGLNHLKYAKLLSARWAEMTGTKDECDFDRYM